MTRRTSGERKAFCEARAAEMVAAPTGAEERLWTVLEPLGFERQVHVVCWTKNGGRSDYILDFGWPDPPRLCVEVDGSSHRNKKGRDRRRDNRLRIHGIRTLRFSNNQVLKKLNDVLANVILEMGA
jgi:very-short-patch-repair endonuclease